MRTSTSTGMQKNRAALRKSGLRQVQIWLPDTRRQGFAAECRRQSLLLQGDSHEREVAEELEGVADHEGWQ